MCTHNNCIYCFGGMDDERSETNNMWRWDLSTDDGFEPVVYRQVLLSTLPQLNVPASAMQSP